MLGFIDIKFGDEIYSYCGNKPSRIEKLARDYGYLDKDILDKHLEKGSLAWEKEYSSWYEIKNKEGKVEFYHCAPVSKKLQAYILHNKPFFYYFIGDKLNKAIFPDIPKFFNGELVAKVPLESIIRNTDEAMEDLCAVANENGHTPLKYGEFVANILSEFPLYCQLDMFQMITTEDKYVYLYILEDIWKLYEADAIVLLNSIAKECFDVNVDLHAKGILSGICVMDLDDYIVEAA